MYNLTEIYDKKFFEDNLEDSSPITKYLGPIIVQKLNIKTMLDFGYTTGHWLNSFLINNVNVGYVCKTIDEYNKLKNNAINRYHNYFKEVVIDKIIKIFKDASKTKMLVDMTDEEIWSNI